MAFETFEDCVSHHCGSLALKLRSERNLAREVKEQESQNYEHASDIVYVCRKLIFEKEFQLKEHAASYILLRKVIFESSQVYFLKEIAQIRHDAA